jgi:hypothetical protein
VASDDIHCFVGSSGSVFTHIVSLCWLSSYCIDIYMSTAEVVFSSSSYGKTEQVGRDLGEDVGGGVFWNVLS